MIEPRYQGLEAGDVKLVASPDGGSLVRAIAGEVAGHRGPGDTHTPITIVHATVAPGAQQRRLTRPDEHAHAECLAIARHRCANSSVAVDAERLAAQRVSDPDLPGAGAERAHLLRELSHRGKDQREDEQDRAISLSSFICRS